MNANVQINGKSIQLNDETLVAINLALMDCPVVGEVYNSKTEKYENPVQQEKRMQLRAVFTLTNDVIVIPAKTA